MTSAPDTDPTTEFLSLRPRLFAVAYRMLGTVSDAEDIVQECFLRWQRTDQNGIENLKGFLIRTVTNLCIDHLRKVRSQREDYHGEWLPEPILTDDPTERTDHDVSVALMLALERLTPLERAAFLLRDVFDVDYAEMSDTLGRAPATCRKLVTRARNHVHDARPRSTVSPTESEAITVAFFKAARTGDTEALSRMLAPDAQLVADGGGKVVTVHRALFGREHLTRFFAGISKLHGGVTPGEWRYCRINSLPGIISYEDDGALIQTTALEIEDGLVTRIYIVRNPDKTTHLATSTNQV